MSEKSPPIFKPRSRWSSFGGVAVLANLFVVAALCRVDNDAGRGGDRAGEGKPSSTRCGGGVEPFVRPNEKVRPPAFSENADDDFGIGGTGISLKGL